MAPTRPRGGQKSELGQTEAQASPYSQSNAAVTASHEGVLLPICRGMNPMLGDGGIPRDDIIPRGILGGRAELGGGRLVSIGTGFVDLPAEGGKRHNKRQEKKASDIIVALSDCTCKSKSPGHQGTCREGHPRKMWWIFCY